MKKIGAIVGVLLMTAAVANAAFTDDSVKLQINTSTHQAYLINTGTDDIPLCGIYIRNSAGKLIPDGGYMDGSDWVAGTFDLASHWVGIACYNDNGHASDISGNTLSGKPLSNAASWAQAGTFPAADNTYYLGENKLSGASTFRAGKSFCIGNITTSTVASDFISSTSVAGKFTWQEQHSVLVGTKMTATTFTYAGTVEIVPEPATMSLLVIGGIATLIRRRR